MALTPEDMAQIAELVKATNASQVAAAVAEASAPKPQVNDEPQNQPENQPEYYVHLADGSVQVSHDSASTHMTNSEGETVQVIGRYPKVVA